MVQVGEPPFAEGSNEVEGQRRSFVPANHAEGIGAASVAREFVLVDDVTAVAWERDTCVMLYVARPRFGVLARDSSDAHDSLSRREHDDQTHLQQQLELAGDLLGLAIVERLRAIPPLEQPCVSLLRCGDSRLEMIDLPTGYQRGETEELLQSLSERGGILVDGLLARRETLPGIWGPVQCHTLAIGLVG